MRGFVFAAAAMCCSALQISCNGEDGPAGPPGIDGTSDKQIRLSLGGFSTSDTSATLCYTSQFITRFNIANYTSLDSVILSANMGASNVSEYCIFELYDVTDSAVIASSTLVSNASGFFGAWPWIYSGNLLNSFPDKEFTLGFRTRSTQQGIGVQVTSAVLLLYRH